MSKTWMVSRPLNANTKGELEEELQALEDRGHTIFSILPTGDSNFYKVVAYQEK